MLFKDHDDLLEQFISFIPSWFEKVAAKDWALSEYAGLYGIRDIESPSYRYLLVSYASNFRIIFPILFF